MAQLMVSSSSVISNRILPGKRSKSPGRQFANDRRRAFASTREALSFAHTGGYNEFVPNNVILRDHAARVEPVAPPGVPQPIDSRGPQLDLQSASAQKRVGFIEDNAVALAAFPGRVTTSSTDADWRSLLVQTIESPVRVGTFETKPSDDVHISVMLRGNCRIANVADSRRQEADFRAGIGCLQSPGSSSRMHWNSDVDGSVDAVHVYLPYRLLEETANGFGSAGDAALKTLSADRVFDDPLLMQMGVALTNAIAEKKPELYARSAAQFLAIHLLTASHSPLASTVGRLRTGLPHNDRRLANAFALMHSDYGNELALSDLAQAAGVSEFYLIELFRKSVGTTPHQYLAKFRLDTAAALLIDTDRTILDIALDTGHGSSAHFAAAFKRAFAQTPREYRLSKRLRNA
jgi:AraC family transcriptional regulator